MLMTGKEYLQSIRDGRVIYIGKERVKDQTTHPAFADGAHTYAAPTEPARAPPTRSPRACDERVDVSGIEPCNTPR
jgi:4-hydroxyphenylacetate 3-monooxygenase